jgi:hypothetical protein
MGIAIFDYAAVCGWHCSFGLPAWCYLLVESFTYQGALERHILACVSSVSCLSCTDGSFGAWSCGSYSMAASTTTYVGGLDERCGFLGLRSVRRILCLEDETRARNCRGPIPMLPVADARRRGDFEQRAVWNLAVVRKPQRLKPAFIVLFGTSELVP